MRGRASERVRESETSVSPPPGFRHQECKVYFGQRQKRKDNLSRSSLPLFRQGGATVSLMTRLSTKRDEGGSIFIGRFVEAIKEKLIRRDVLVIL